MDKMTDIDGKEYAVTIIGTIIWYKTEPGRDEIP